MCRPVGRYWKSKQANRNSWGTAGKAIRELSWGESPWGATIPRSTFGLIGVLVPFDPPRIPVILCFVTVVREQKTRRNRTWRGCLPTSGAFWAGPALSTQRYVEVMQGFSHTMAHLRDRWALPVCFDGPVMVLCVLLKLSAGNPHAESEHEVCPETSCTRQRVDPARLWHCRLVLEGKEVSLVSACPRHELQFKWFHFWKNESIYGHTIYSFVEPSFPWPTLNPNSTRIILLPLGGSTVSCSPKTVEGPLKLRLRSPAFAWRSARVFGGREVLEVLRLGKESLSRLFLLSYKQAGVSCKFVFMCWIVMMLLAVKQLVRGVETAQISQNRNGHDQIDRMRWFWGLEEMYLRDGEG